MFGSAGTVRQPLPTTMAARRCHTPIDRSSTNFGRSELLSEASNQCSRCPLRSGVQSDMFWSLWRSGVFERFNANHTWHTS
eukprot:15451120-Alexandrium_andersonii.AAC.1